VFSIVAVLPKGRQPSWLSLKSLSSLPGQALAKEWEEGQAGPIRLGLSWDYPKETIRNFSINTYLRGLKAMASAPDGHLNVSFTGLFDHPDYPNPISKVLAFISICSTPRNDPNWFVRSEIAVSFRDSESSFGRVSSSRFELIRSELVDLVTGQLPAFAYSSLALDPPPTWGVFPYESLYDARTCTDLLLDGYSWLVCLSPAMIERFRETDSPTPDKLGFETEVITTSMGDYLLCRSSRQPADLSAADVVAWKDALKPVLPIPDWVGERPNPRPPWILPKDWGSFA
jgi:hypothetical protein